MSAVTLHERHGRASLLAATDDHPFIRYDVPPHLTETWWQVEGAVAFRRSRKARTSFTLLGHDDAVAGLVDRLPELAARSGQPPRRPTTIGVSVPQHLETLLHQRFRVGDGGDWEWFWTDTAPAPRPDHERVAPLDDVARHDEVTAFLARHSPTADTAPGGGERWFAIEDGGRLVAVAAYGHTLVGAPSLSSVAVDDSLRGQGLGRLIVGAVTRLAVAEQGVCTLGMYSHNDAARALYRSLGYDNPCRWASRAVILAA